MTILRHDDGAIRTLTLHRPDALNALTPALLTELADALSEAAVDGSVRNGQDRGMTDALQFEYDTEYPMSGAGERLGTFGKG